MNWKRWIAGPLLSLPFVLALVLSARTGAVEPVKPANAAAEPELPFHKRMLEIAAGYRSLSRVTSEPKLAPQLCEASGLRPAGPQLSRSEDDDTHGRKLYYLFASDKNAYTNDPKKPQPVGQILVKESWTAETPAALPKDSVETVKHVGVPDLNKPGRTVTVQERVSRVLVRGGKVYHTGKPGELFIMYKAEPQTRGTDQGWVYGTVSADGKTVGLAGRIATCMGCHSKVEGDRLFGK